ncbi:C-type lectin lectoxin-Lio2 [Danio rerio]|uniref:C-type lectin lectoxin-Lio2 n=1 Tax=Danio rerio TaxID=7955 RepID=A0AC58G2M7_DANRE|nr:C-type lectin lectoxin-Lio2-like [Danio rerio]|eukprot:XP_021333760.1 C-type lectin lectoxin-Lio2-like [Danio rerio]
METVLLLLLLTALTPTVSSQSYTFYFVAENMSWSNAQTYCRQHYIDLASVLDYADVEEALGSIDPDYYANVWIGLYRHGPTDPWLWSDSGTSTFIPWGPGQPNNYANSQYCVELERNWVLNDLNCNTKLSFVCYKERSKQTAKLTVKSSQNLTDPAVKTQILQKIEQVMKEKGLINYLKLAWKTQSDGDVFQKSPQKGDTPHICS